MRKILELNNIKQPLGAVYFDINILDVLYYANIQIMILTLTYTVLVLLVINYDKSRVFILYVEGMVEGELS